MKITGIMDAFIAVVAVVVLTGCTGTNFEGAAVVQPPLAQTPMLSNLPPEIIGIYPQRESQACLRPQVGVDLRPTDAMRRSGAFDLSTVILTLDGNDVTQKAAVRGTFDYPQSRVSLLYIPAAPLAAGTHRAQFTFPSASDRVTTEWAFTIADIACPPNEGSPIGQPPGQEPPGMSVGGQPPLAQTPTPSNLPPEIIGMSPQRESQVCPSPQVGVNLRLTDAMRRNGTFDSATVTLTLDGNDVTQKAKVRATTDLPQSRVSLLYTPAAPLAAGTHRAAFTFPSSGRVTVEWTFTVANISCPSPDDEPVGFSSMDGTPLPPSMLSEIANVRPPEGSQVCPRPQISLDLHLTDRMRKNGVFDPSTVTLAVDGVDVTQMAKVLGTMDFPQSRVTFTYTPSTLSLGTHRAALTYPSASDRKTHTWTFTVANIPCP
jgi:hypothetical protein